MIINLDQDPTPKAPKKQVQVGYIVALNKTTGAEAHGASISRIARAGAVRR